jgi:hypothetical protein
MLQERARQVAAERAANTTDDDTTSELKFGKFCPLNDESTSGPNHSTNFYTLLKSSKSKLGHY